MEQADQRGILFRAGPEHERLQRFVGRLCRGESLAQKLLDFLQIAPRDLSANGFLAFPIAVESQLRPLAQYACTCPPVAPPVHPFPLSDASRRLPPPQVAPRDPQP